MFDWFRSAQLDRIERKLDLIIRREKYEMTQQQDIKDAMDVMRADMTAQTTVVGGMSVFIAGIQKQLVDMANATKDTETASALMALAAQAESNTKSLSDAMTTNLTGVTSAQAGATEPAPAPNVNPTASTDSPAPVPTEPAPATTPFPSTSPVA